MNNAMTYTEFLELDPIGELMITWKFVDVVGRVQIQKVYFLSQEIPFTNFLARERDYIQDFVEELARDMLEAANEPETEGLRL